MEDKLSKILIVSKHSTFRRLISASLKNIGRLSFENAEDGLEALDKLSTIGKPELVITGVDMPRINGIEFYKQAIKNYPYIKDRFLFMTGNDRKECLEFFKENNIKHLIKPAPIYVLKNVVLKFMERENFIA